MASRALFVSDIHIQSPADEKYALFRSFLDACLEVKPNFLFLVGDIFDLWVADRDYFVHTYSALIQRVRDLKASGIEIYYFEGNHDLDLKVFWQEQMGVKVFSEPAYFDLLGHTVRVEHGDEMDPDDKGYKFLRWLLRTPAGRGLGRHLPNPAVKWVGERASQVSRDYTSNVKTVTEGQVRDKFLSHIGRAYSSKAFDVLVAGHVHVAEDVSVLRNGKTIRGFNLGTWLKEPLVLELTESSLRLRKVSEFID